MTLTDKLPAAAAALLACALLGAVARAEESPCRADIEKFCKDVQPGEGRVVKCLKEHEAGLSADCRAKGEELKEKLEGLKEACQADLDKFCKDVQPGEGRLAKCLKGNETELSPVCAKKITEEKEEFLKNHPCAADAEKFCKDVEPGEGRKLKCMKEHEAELSPECRAKKEEFLKDHPCAADMEKLCKDVEPGEGRKLKCMKEHEAELSEACKAKIAEKKEELKKNSPCAPDIEKFCKGVEPGEGRLLKCLKEHEAGLSAECREKGEELKERAADIKEACRPDLAKFCRDVREGEGRLLQCLKRHGKEVSAPCKAQLAEARAGMQEKRQDGLHEKREGRKEKPKEKREERMEKRGLKGPGKPHPGKK